MNGVGVQCGATVASYNHGIGNNERETRVWKEISKFVTHDHLVQDVLQRKLPSSG